jgi:DNA-binding IclR family transcriptional regulator
MASKGDPGGTQSLDRAVAVLRIVASRAGKGIRLVDVVERSGLSKPTVHRLLQALERQGLVAQDMDTRLYHLGPEAFVIGTLAAERYGIQRAARSAALLLPRRTPRSSPSGVTGRPSACTAKRVRSPSARTCCKPGADIRWGLGRPALLFFRPFRTRKSRTSSPR